MEDKITIIEGPPPEFTVPPEDWAWGLTDSPYLAEVALTKVRTFNGPALVERCYKAWKAQMPINLEYRTMDGLMEEAPIIAARNVVHEEGDMLFLWVRLAEPDIELEIGYDDDFNDEDEDFLD